MVSQMLGIFADWEAQIVVILSEKEINCDLSPERLNYLSSRT